MKKNHFNKQVSVNQLNIFKKLGGHQLKKVYFWGMIKKTSLIFLIVLSFLGNAQNQKLIDSLRNVAQKGAMDTNTVKVYYTLTLEYQKFELDSAVVCAQKMIDISKKIGNVKWESNGFNQLGNTRRNQGKLEEALAAYFASMKIKEKIQDIKGIAGLQNNIGMVYEAQSLYPQALDYYYKAVETNKKVKNLRWLSINYTNIGNTYGRQDKLDSAQVNFERALIISEQLKDQPGIAFACANLGIIYKEHKNFERALFYQERALKIREELKNPFILTSSYYAIGVTYKDMKKYPEALNHMQKALELAEQTKNIEAIGNAHSGLATVNELIGNYKTALHHTNLHHAFSDTILNREKSRNLADMETKYDTEKKQQEIALLNKDKKFQRTVNYALFGGLGLIVVLAFVLYQGNVRKRKDNHKLLQKNNEINQQKEEILAQSDQLQLVNVALEQQKEEIIAQSENLKIVNTALEQQKEEILSQSEVLQKINDELEQQKSEVQSSIRYASRIQQAILPFQEQLQKSIPEHFVWFKPRDIVSGDLYWFAEKGDWVILAAIDCTGHGVPGAFMSMIGNALLNQIVHDWEVYEPNLILEHLHRGVRKALQQENNESQDGMDVAMISWNRKTKNLLFAGAMNPLYCVKNGQLMEIKGDKHPIGGVQVEEERKFSLHTLAIDEPIHVYLASDGFQDQFGGTENKKFKVKPFKELLTSIAQLPIQSQKTELTHTFETWKGNGEQTDDIVLIGLKIA